ncbi:Gfo/Idh/MocA family protein [Pararhodonellum marinum]|uniref:Gfo/Idh/MocA family protein n=1 Tax=Pararhodonellum marinum TaxID=2755358 RepID=UPI00188F3D2E|nr:Gfo/Idh/MocA family oxidoreductase [Pararhodonellum marinum]
MNRRDFVRYAAIGAGSFAIPGGLYSTVSRTLTDPFRLGIIGFGDRGSGIYKVLRDFKDEFRVTAICDNLPFRLDRARKQTTSDQITYFADYRKLLDSNQVDAVIIATPLNEHFEQAKNSLLAGKHIYLEKTMAFSIQEAQELVKLAENHSKLVLQVGHQYRYSPLYYKVKEMISEGYLGNVTQIDARWDRNWNWRRPLPEPQLERQVNWRMYKEYSGGLVAELLSHQMDFIHWAFEATPDSLYGTGGIDHFKDGRETYDNVQVTARYESLGMIGNFGATCANQYEDYSFIIKGSKGTVSLLMNDGIFYPEPESKKALEEVDGVSGATPLNWNDNKTGINLSQEKYKDGTFYAFEDFHRSLIQKSLPASNVYTGAKTAIAVALSNQAIYQGSVENWPKTA